MALLNLGMKDVGTGRLGDFGVAQRGQLYFESATPNKLWMSRIAENPVCGREIDLNEIDFIRPHRFKRSHHH